MSLHLDINALNFTFFIVVVYDVNESNFFFMLLVLFFSH